MDFYNYIKPALMRMDAERAHGLALAALKSGLMPAVFLPADPALSVTLWNRKFPNPVGLAAGFDKNAAVIAGAFRMGFGFVEAGTVTPKPQGGNPRPRIFRAPDYAAIINRMGFPNEGLGVFKTNLERFMDTRPRPPGVLGVNIGMNKDQADPARDYCQLVQQLGPMADYLTVNISSPNTPGLRNLQEPDAFLDLTGKILEERVRSCGAYPPPLLVKLSPDLDEGQQEALAEAVLRSGIDGLILTNTTLARPDNLPPDFTAEKGGLSGAPVKDRATETIRRFYKLTNGTLPIIGAGGIASGRDAYEKIRAGASLVQLYSGLIYRGPGLIGAICGELSALLKQDGFTNVLDAVGADNLPTGESQQIAAAH